MKKTRFLFFLAAVLIGGCIGDDIIFDTVPEDLRIINPLDTLAVGDSFTFELLFTNNIGREEDRAAVWTSSDPAILEVDESGTATGISKGLATLTATVELDNKSLLSIDQDIVVDEETVESDTEGSARTGVIKTTSSYLLTGSFEVRKEGTNLIIDIAEDYRASTALPGLYVYLTNNPNTSQGALEIGEVEIFEGAHVYTLEGDIPLNQYNYLLYYCKPFNVKVGDGEIGE